ncbi:hypothetical protein V500_00208 [Pseudogymnoascus sp. VKM F-4518 (FW-2643)]|nr:hypothetical protein V500_00208 [Pseudogymnoascus sp. VKM F-4518 (FW-2643)]
MSSTRYESLSTLPLTEAKSSEEDESSSDTALLQDEFRKTFATPQFFSGSYVPWAISAVISLLCLGLLIDSIRMHTAASQSCVAKHSIWSPALGIVNEEYNLLRYSGTFKNGSPYKGPPSPSVDAAWDNITEIGTFAIDKEGVIRTGADPEFAVRYPDDVGAGAGGKYMATLEVFHQIHCVNLLWKTTYPDYYTEIKIDFMKDEKTLRNHLDHCADLLRQSLQCTGDTSVITYDWVNGRDIPYPNFNTLHKCRNFDNILQWGKAHQLPKYHNGRFLKPAGTPGREMPP